MTEIKDLLYSYLPSIKAYIPDFILSGMDKLPDASGYGFLIAIILLLPILRTFTYTLIHPIGTITNTFAGVCSLTIRTLFQMFSSVSITITNITMSWLSAINSFLLIRSNYLILILSMIISSVALCFYLEEKMDAYVILISTALTTLIYAVYKYKSPYLYNRQQ